jgi:nucleotide-binding universal stress UspA family protein
MPGVVVGIDGSDEACRALNWAMREAAIRETALSVFTVIPAMASPWTGNPLSVPDGEAAVKRARHAAEDAVAKSSTELGESQPASVTIDALIGYPAQVLIDASQSADLIVVGSRGGGGFGRLLLGSTSSQVSQHAACPVVIVPAHRS